MSLTLQQKQTLKALVNSDPTQAANLAAGNDMQVAAWLNTESPGNEVCWKTSVSIEEVGRAFNGAEWAGMTTANHTRLTTVAAYAATVNPSLADIRAMFDDIWSGAGGTNTRANLLTLWKRKTKRAELALATGPVSGVYTLVFEGDISYAQVSELRSV
jgi:hypothetical protein